MNPWWAKNMCRYIIHSCHVARRYGRSKHHLRVSSLLLLVMTRDRRERGPAISPTERPSSVASWPHDSVQPSAIANQVKRPRAAAGGARGAYIKITWCRRRCVSPRTTVLMRRRGMASGSTSARRRHGRRGASCGGSVKARHGRSVVGRLAGLPSPMAWL